MTRAFRRNARIVLPIVAVAVTAAVVAPALANAPSSAYPVKSSHKVDVWNKVRVNSADYNANKQLAAVGSKPGKGKTFVTVNVTCKRLKGNQNCDYYETFSLIGAKTKKSYGEALTGASGQLSSAKGKTQTGNLVFKVANADLKGDLILKDTGENGQESATAPVYFKTKK